MKKSILATTILLLISVSLILLTFGISERIAIINYNNESEINNNIVVANILFFIFKIIPLFIF